MNKQVPLFFLVALLVSLPGCMNKDKGKMKDMSKKQKMGMGHKKMYRGDMMAQGEGAEMNVADADLADDSFNNLFRLDDLDELTAYGDDLDDRDLYAADDARDDFETLYFGFDKSKLDDDQAAKLRLNAERAKQLLADASPNAKLVVEGYACPSAGKIWYNKQISQKRAEMVAAELERAGIDRDCMQIVGCGTARPILKEGSRDEQWLNRRVELNVVQA
jgi:outer membrane protein OmpA-like peptidoglycan-associated protein